MAVVYPMPSLGYHMLLLIFQAAGTKSSLGSWSSFRSACDSDSCRPEAAGSIPLSSQNKGTVVTVFIKVPASG